MESFEKVTGLVALLDQANIDTDQIIPKQFLKRIERTGFGQFLFFDWRWLDEGQINHDFELNQDRYKGAKILVTRQNFGCGSSREHAPWAIQDYGFKCIIAPSFADIFFNNCFKNGLLPICLSEDQVEEIFCQVKNTVGYKITVNLKTQKVITDDGLIYKFKVDEFRRYCLLNGLDDIDLTMLHEEKIGKFETDHLLQLSIPSKSNR
ncbi:MAG: 3-isopropylmalate dehydratase small subunit [Acidobacteriia bacterium]|jgi:3-isopropylmalate/(R)-2-methylmalate dehydratase small subunit|nr:3-isopropylmalate dehydratase small subunit [Terriglobia bacterium]